MDDNFQPLIIALCCNWCSYAGADLAGVSRTQYPPSIRIVRVMCSGMVHPNLVIDAFTKGADGVLICGCHHGDCHYQEGNYKTEKRAEAIRLDARGFWYRGGALSLGMGFGGRRAEVCAGCAGVH